MPVPLTRSAAAALARGLQLILNRLNVRTTYQQCLGYIAEAAGWRNQETLAANYLPDAPSPSTPPATDADIELALNRQQQQSELIKTAIVRRTATSLVAEITRLTTQLPPTTNHPDQFRDACLIQDSQTQLPAINQVENRLAEWFTSSPFALHLFLGPDHFTENSLPEDASNAAAACVNAAYRIAEQQWKS